MNKTRINRLLSIGLCSAIAFSAVSCDDNDNELPAPEVPGAETSYVLGLGVTTPESTTNYVLRTDDIMNGVLSLKNQGELQEGYRDFANIGNYFQSIGGLGLTDVNSYYLDESNQLAVKTGLNLQDRPVDTYPLDPAGKQYLAVTLPDGPTSGTELSFRTVDVAANAVVDTKQVEVNKTNFPMAAEWILHTGIVVRGNQAFQTILPFDSDTWETKDTDKTYVVVYSYPDFTIEKIIEDERTGPAGSFNTRSGIFVTESGDIYTISHSGYGFSQRSKDPAVLRIKAGSDEFDQDYLFKTLEVENGGRIVHASYIGDNKLFATVSSGEQVAQWDDQNLKFAIVDLANQRITTIEGSPVFAGDGGRSFATFQQDGKAYAAANVDGELNIYQIDLKTATLKKGAKVEASFVGGLGVLN